MLTKRRLIKLMKEKIRNVWLFRVVSLISGLAILFTLYKMDIIAIAFINGQPISVSEVIKIYTSDDKESVLDKIIAEKLLEYEAKKRNIQVTADEVAREIERAEKRAIENGMTMAQLLEESDQTAKELEKNTRLRIIVYKILSEDIELSEDEIDDYIRENPQLYENLNEDDVREDIRRLLIDAKLNDEYNTWIQEAKASSEVQYLFRH